MCGWICLSDSQRHSDRQFHSEHRPVTAHQGSGWYFRFGGDTWFDASIGIEAGAADDLNAFGGDSEGYCGDVSVAKGCYSSKSSGKP